MSDPNEEEAQSGRGIWIYRRTNTGGFERVSVKAFDEFTRGKRQLPGTVANTVYIAFICVVTRHRQPEAISRIDWTRHETNEQGFQTEEHLRRELHAAASFVAPPDQPTQSSVLDGMNRFEQRRFAWKPSRDDLKNLAAVVNARAGKKLL